MTRRTTFAGLVVALAGLLVPFGLAATSGADAASGGGAGGTGGTGGGQRAAAKAATDGFTHPAGATKAGYSLLKDADGIACISMKGMGAMGVHYVNGSLVDSKIQVRHPEATVYRFTSNGHLRLSALEYIVLRKDWRSAHSTGRPELFGQRFNLTKAGNRFGLPAFYSLHAWLWYDNPAGRFTMWNPRVHCPSGI